MFGAGLTSPEKMQKRGQVISDEAARLLQNKKFSRLMKSGAMQEDKLRATTSQVNLRSKSRTSLLIQRHQ
jgi:hypothetical protein